MNETVSQEEARMIAELDRCVEERAKLDAWLAIGRQALYGDQSLGRKLPNGGRILSRAEFQARMAGIRNSPAFLAEKESVRRARMNFVR